MRKFATITIAIVLTVAGCSASAVNAITKNTNTVSHYGVVIKDKPKEDPKVTLLFSKSKEKRNYARMQLNLEYLKSRVHKTPYVFSGASHYGWDCSGMVVWLYRHFGLELPHSATAQAHIGTRVSDPNVGDIVVFAYSGRTDFYHSAIYIGNNMVINANRGSGTTIIQPLSDYKRSQIRFVRVIDQKS